MTNYLNWGGGLNDITRQNMAILEERGVYKRVNMKHEEIPLYFFKVYKDKII